jgi:hypothetical protein
MRNTVHCCNSNVKVVYTDIAVSLQSIHAHCDWIGALPHYSLIVLFFIQVVAQVSAGVVERAHFLLSLPCTVTATTTTAAAAAHGRKGSDGINGWQVSSVHVTTH